LSEDQRPCCMSERGFFMAPFEILRTKNHPYAETSPDTHGHFRPTAFRQPRYSADAIPFRWMQRPGRWMNAKTPSAPEFRVCCNHEYQYSCLENKAPLRALLWERIIQQSIRPDGNEGFNDGFLLPYCQALAYAEQNPEFDPAQMVAFAPDDRRDEFSYVTQH